MSGPTVTVLVPARDEAADIGRALAALRAQDHPLGDIEVLVVDGGSSDGTAEVARRELDGHGFGRVEVVPNPTATTPSNLNAGLARATGDVLCRVDARSLVPPDYVRRCTAILRGRPEVVVVGGSQVAVARSGATGPTAIARALNNPWATGLARYRRSSRSGPADTVYLGAFRTADVRRAGGWDEGLPTNQDFDLNRRLAREGTVWFEAGLPVGYLPRASLPALVSQHVRFGRAKVAYWRRTGDRPRPRQLLLLAGPLVGAAAATGWIAHGSVARRAVAVAAAGAAAGLAVDELGARGSGAPVRVRLAAVAAMAGIGGGWAAGVLGSLASVHPPPAGPRPPS